MQSNNDEIKNLKEENKRLKQQLEAKDEQQKNKQKRTIKIARKGAELWVGSELKDSFYKLYDELPNVSKDTFAEFSANVLMRLTKIGVIGIGLALLPTLFLIIQTIIFANQTGVLKDQTKKIEIQNDKIEKQVYLEEASRRNNLVFLMDNILSKVNLEITDSNKTLSIPLIGRISALSQGLQPYYFLEDSTNLTAKKYSPERGQFLLALANSGIDTSTMDVIYKKALFSSAYLKGAILDSLYLKGAILNDANLQNAKLRQSDLQSADLKGAKFEGAVLVGADLQEADLRGAILQGVKLWGANLQGADLRGADLREAYLPEVNLSDANLSDAKLKGVYLRKANLTNLKVKIPDWIDKLEEWNVKDRQKIKEKYIVNDSGERIMPYNKIIYQLELKNNK